MTDMLSVTGRHLDHVSAELDLLTSPILPATFAFIASREGDLVARSPWVGRSPENMACQEQQRRIVVERSAGVTAKLCHCLPKRRESLRRNVEPQDTLVPAHEAFDLTNRSPSCDLDPLVLAFGSGNTGELTRRRPPDVAVAKGFSKLGQAFERFRYPQSLFGPPRPVTKDALDVLGEASEAQMEMDAGAKGAQERATFLPVELRASLG